MENLKDALTVLINISEKTDEALEDGRVSIAEGISIAFSAVGLIKVIKNIKSLVAEFKALTPEERTELAEWFSVEFDIQDDNLEAIIEEIFAVLLQLGGLLDSVK